MQPVTLMPTVEELVDELGPIEAALATLQAARWKADEKKAAALRKLIADKITAAADASTTVKGTKYTAVIGPRENQTKIVSLAKVYAIAKKEAFLAACSFTLKALEQLVPDAGRRARLVKVERTGSRSVATYPIENPKKGMQKAA